MDWSQKFGLTFLQDRTFHRCPKARGRHRPVMGAKLKKLKNTPASKKAASNGSVAGFSKSKKQARGPKAYIEDATVEQNGGDGADDDDEAVERALDAEEMAAAVLTESEDEEQGQSTSKQSKGKSRASDADLAFLLNMDKRAISR